MKLTGVKQFAKCMNMSRDNIYSDSSRNLKGLLVYADMVASTNGHIAKVRLMDTGIENSIFIPIAEKGTPDEIELVGTTPNKIRNLFGDVRIDETELTIHDVKGFKRYLKASKYKFIHVDFEKNQINSYNGSGDVGDIVDMDKFITIDKNLNQVDGINYQSYLMLIALTNVNTPVKVSFYSNMSSTMWRIDEKNFYLLLPMRH